MLQADKLDRVTIRYQVINSGAAALWAGSIFGTRYLKPKKRGRNPL